MCRKKTQKAVIQIMISSQVGMANRSGELPFDFNFKEFLSCLLSGRSIWAE